MATSMLSSLITRCGVNHANRFILQSFRPAIWTSTNGFNTSEIDAAKQHKIPKMSEQRKELAEKVLERMPHRPLSSFMLFSKEKRPEVAKKYPDKKLVEVSQIIGSLWRNLPEKDKKYYSDLSLPLREKYKEDIKRFKENLTEKEVELLSDYRVEKLRVKDEREHKKFIKESNKPKRATTGYQLFIQLNKDSIPKTPENKGKTLPLLAKVWKKLPEEEKKRYNDQAAQEKPQLEKEMSAWIQKMVLTEQYDLVTKAEVKKELAKLGKPKGRVQAINVFTMEHKGDYGSVAEAAKEYHNLTDEQMEAYKKKAEEISKQHAKAYEKWMEKMEAKGHKEFVQMAEKYVASRKPIVKAKGEEEATGGKEKVVKEKKFASKKPKASSVAEKQQLNEE